MSKEVLGIRLPKWAHEKWPRWFAPERLPFATGSLSEADRAALPRDSVREVPMELQDTFWIYGADKARLWLSHNEFEALPVELRRRLVRAQRDEHEAWLHGPTGGFGPWWSHALDSDLAPVVEFVERDCAPSRHREVGDETWACVVAVLPNARKLAGTFALGSGPNCFGTVMGAAGVDGAEDEWMQREQFEEWLGTSTVLIHDTAHDEKPGIVFVWRSADSAVQHACITLGDGWMLNKPSQGWMSPRFVWTIHQTKHHSRSAGLHLERHRVTLD